MKAFQQDWEVLELQQANWDDRPIVATNADAGLIAARALIDKFIAAEARQEAAE